jgi:hypothetical protein
MLYANKFNKLLSYSHDDLGVPPKSYGGSLVGLESGKKKIHWKSWECSSTPEDLGGMGLHDLVLFN